MGNGLLQCNYTSNILLLKVTHSSVWLNQYVCVYVIALYLLVCLFNAGMQIVTDRKGDKAKVSSVLLLTDGLANVGITKREPILDEMRKLLDPAPVSLVLATVSVTIVLHCMGQYQLGLDSLKAKQTHLDSLKANTS